MIPHVEISLFVALSEHPAPKIIVLFPTCFASLKAYPKRKKTLSKLFCILNPS